MHPINLVNEENQVTPNYRLDGKEMYFDVYVSPDKEVCVLGKLDTNYLVWCSITTVFDAKKNASLFDFIIDNKCSFVSNEHQVLGKQYNEVKNWHVFRISKKLYNGELRYYSNASSLSFSTGTAFASEIQVFYQQEKAKSEFRIMNKKYVAILKEYKKTLDNNNDEMYYLTVKPLIDVIRSESYLKLCQEAKVRALYLELSARCDTLYNRYMTAVR
ncbi:MULTISPECIES: hypothetical protein [Sutcliffiella]|uniref:Uncharacterized protein n=1 Tax=Sutcliffiella cohnii TaxID=33932 RepID=A0A223KP55_9BACI|nr:MULTISPECIES: hypothetical protein [Sutcliffiella]AST91177.1 hypothetical protein BC6307_07740 [Sutcliffiella cohnii]WBL16986.1 hypothetical protein O1A01_10285 [Sutcliffiella sp. NC1]